MITMRFVINIPFPLETNASLHFRLQLSDHTQHQCRCDFCETPFQPKQVVFVSLGLCEPFRWLSLTECGRKWKTEVRKSAKNIVLIIRQLALASSHFFTDSHTRVEIDKSCKNVRRMNQGSVRVRYRSHEIATQSSHFVDRAGWQAKMASNELWMNDAFRPSWEHGHPSWHSNKEVTSLQFREEAKCLWTPYTHLFSEV